MGSDTDRNRDRQGLILLAECPRLVIKSFNGGNTDDNASQNCRCAEQKEEECMQLTMTLYMCKLCCVSPRFTDLLLWRSNNERFFFCVSS